jgi:hypothetical protein
VRISARGLDKRPCLLSNIVVIPTHQFEQQIDLGFL